MQVLGRTCKYWGGAYESMLWRRARGGGGGRGGDLLWVCGKLQALGNICGKRRRRAPSRSRDTLR